MMKSFAFRAFVGLIILLSPALPANAMPEEMKTSMPVTEILLQRDGGEKGPTDILTLRADGTADYEGKKNVAHPGFYHGRIPYHEFTESFPLLSKLYQELVKEPPSTGKPTDGVTLVTIHVKGTTERKEIVDHCPGIDIRLWSFEKTLLGVASDVQWKKIARRHGH